MPTNKITHVYKGNELVHIPDDRTLYFNTDGGIITLHFGRNYTELDNKYINDCKIWDKIQNKIESIELTSFFS